METKGVLQHMFDRVWAVIDGSLDGLTRDELERRPSGESNSMGWLAWHLGRVEDRWIHRLTQPSQEAWRLGWADRMGMGDMLETSGGGMTLEEVAAFKTPSLELLQGYLAKVREDTQAYIDGLTASELDREIETWFGRSMTIGEVFAQVVCEMNQHAGQLAYLKGLYRGFQ